MNKIKNNESGFSVIELTLLLIITLVIVTIGWLVYENKHKTIIAPIKSPSKNNPSINSSDYSIGIKFSGTITSDECATSRLPTGDVGCNLTVDNKIIDVQHGNMVNIKPWGKLYNFPEFRTDPSGKKVDVYAHQLSKTSYTLDGSAEYYVKITN
ncbi:MAG: hypothetical protein WCI37_02410 [bacterium]